MKKNKQETTAPPAASPNDAKYFSTHDVAKMLQVDPSTVSKWVDKEILAAFRTPGGHRRIQGAKLRQFCETYKMPVPAAVAAAEVACG